MIRHCVMFKWNDRATDESKAEVAAGLDRLALMPCIQSYTHGPDAGLVDGNWDYVVVGDFATEDDYRTYAGDGDHQRLIADVIRPNISDRAAIQYVIA